MTRVDDTHCPVCRSALLVQKVGEGTRDADRFSCPMCGDFILTRTAVINTASTTDGDIEAETKISHAIRKAQQPNKAIPEFDSYAIDKILESELPRPAEQANLLMRWLGDNAPDPGDRTSLRGATHRTIIGSKNPDGFFLIIQHLLDEGLIGGPISKTRGADGNALVHLTFRGWERYEDLNKGSASHGKAFMAMEYDDALLDSVVDNVFKPAAKRAGFLLFRLDDVPVAGLIDDRLRVEIQAADFVIADLSHDNLGAYWEAGYAEGLGKPVIYTCNKEKFNDASTHFDTNHHLTVVWDEADPSSAGSDLTATIRATLPDIATMRSDNE